MAVAAARRAAAAIAGIIGTGLAIAATRDAYAYDRPGAITAAARPITSGPGYYYGGPGYHYSNSREYAGTGRVGSRRLCHCSRSGDRLLVSLDHDRPARLPRRPDFCFYAQRVNALAIGLE